ncbi:uncharacterized protein LOC131285006 [Anopheles ziemanni]|uniref:uncharacterized protein LOC131262886 n=1 Tax=Anopheles coustani TaxID=139045 RepID=UPI00265B0499|nr:uncharacterized protein LOC131262886 [Anopheles coustani]XP_058169850.1 uncharacterized protein LOC131285006 [Anopheles ziemanni]
MVYGSIVQQPVEANGLPGTLGRLIGECFDRDTRTLYLVGLEQLHNFQNYLALPYPKVIIPQATPIGMPDEAALVLIYLPVNSKEELRSSMRIIMHSWSKIVRNGKYVVLMEDAYLVKPRVAVPMELGIVFATYNIVYWCVTGFRRAENLQYWVPFALSAYFMENPVQYGSAFEWTRGRLPNVSLEIYGQATLTFPYTHHIGGGLLRGIDLEIFVNLLHHLNHRLRVEIVEYAGDVEEERDKMTNRLHEMKVDLMITRKDVVPETLPVIYVPEVSYYCLIAPRSTVLDLTQSLLRPFSTELWMCVTVAGLLISGLLALAKHTKCANVGTLVRWSFQCKPLASILATTYAIVRFILLESYLAKVTSFFLAYRFQPDANTLDEFFATDIPIWLPTGYNHFVERLGDDLRSRILERALDDDKCMDFSARCAQMDSFARATYVVNHDLPADPVTGRKPFYIVPEMLASYTHLGYAFARGSALVDLFAVYLRRMHEAGLVQLYYRQYEQYLMRDRLMQKPVDQSLEFDHLLSVWICVSLSWGVSFVVFLVELLLNCQLMELLRVWKRALAGITDVWEPHSTNVVPSSHSEVVGGRVSSPCTLYQKGDIRNYVINFDEAPSVSTCIVGSADAGILQTGVSSVGSDYRIA